jgi:CRISPR-associated protein Cst1
MVATEITSYKLHYIGHPFIDVGVATITAYAAKKKQRPEDVTLEEMQAIAEYLKDIYCHKKPVQNFISVIFTNSHFVQSAKPVEEKEAYADQFLFAFQNDRLAEADDLRCTFFPELAAVMYAHRQHIPLLNGESVSNFSPMGTRGIPVSGAALLAIHAMPLGCYKCGHLLAFHQLSDFTQADGGKMTLMLARKALEANLRAISMMSPDRAEGGLPSYGSYSKTRYIDTILRARSEVQSRDANIDNITGYFFTNYGPKPNLEFLRLDNSILRFIDAAQQDAAAAWQRVVYFGWQQPKGEETTPDEQNTETWRNQVYERLFELNNQAGRFLALLAQGRDWRLIEIFLERIMCMERERIQVYRELGDRLAEYMLKYESGSTGFYYEIRRAKEYGKLRSRIFSAAERMLKASNEQPLFTYDEFILAFEHPSDTYSQWRLARDLIAIRMLEVLHSHQVDLSTLPEVLEEETEE